MTVPAFLFLSLALTSLAVLADRSLEIVHGRSVFTSPAFVALFAFWWCVLLPAVVYYSAAYGDWFLLYLVKTKSLSPLWWALGGCVWMGLGVFAFWGSARWLQMGMRSSVLTMTLLFSVFGAATWIVTYPRLSAVGTIDQWYHRDGLENFWSSQLGLASAWIVLIIGAAFALLYTQLRRARV